MQLLTSTYDAAGRLVTGTDAAGRVTMYRYDAVGRKTETIYADDTPLDPSDNPRIKTEYNLAGEVVATIDELGNRTEYEYDAAGRKIVVRDPLGNTARTAYDASGAVISVTDALDRTTTYHYDSAGRQVSVTMPDGATRSRTLNASGRPVSITDENGITTAYAFNAGDQLTLVTDALGNDTSYEYDNRGKLTSQTDANGNVTRFEYDIVGRETARLLPGGQLWSSSYDVMGRIAQTTDPNGNAISFAYDSLGRMVTKTRSDGAVFNYTYTATGKVASITEPRGIVQYSYDKRDRLLTQIEPDGKTVSYTYSLNGQILSMTTLAGTVSYNYDAAGRLITVTDQGLATTRYDYNAAGELIRTEFANGVVEDRQYDTRGNVIHIIAVGPSGVLTSYSYQRDPTGRVVSSLDDGTTVHYTFDAAYRLVSEKTIGGEEIEYTYDAVGNRLTRTDSSGSTTYEYDNNDRLKRTTDGTKITLYAYDAAGNQIRTETGADHSDYKYNAENKMIRADVLVNGNTNREEYRYDANGNRVAVISDGDETKYLVDLSGELSRVIVEYTASGQVIATSVYGIGIIGETRGGDTSVFLTDRLRSIRMITDATGVSVAAFNYDAFGNVIAEVGFAETSLRFSGEPLSQVTGLSYLRARMYDPITGRFESADPFRGLIDSPATLNKYVYANSDPVNNTDPTGYLSLAEMSVATGIIATTTLIGASYGYTKAKALGRSTFWYTAGYGLAGFGIGVAAVSGTYALLTVGGGTAAESTVGQVLYKISSSEIGKVVIQKATIYLSEGTRAMLTAESIASTGGLLAFGGPLGIFSALFGCGVDLGLESLKSILSSVGTVSSTLDK
ncbi:MAG: RHS repeat-associated core domain-containing protein [Pirellulales bacterium]